MAKNELVDDEIGDGRIPGTPVAFPVNLGMSLVDGRVGGRLGGT